MINIKKELIQGVHTLNKSLFDTAEILCRNNSRDRVKGEKLFIEHAVFIDAEFHAVPAQKFIYLVRIADFLHKVFLLEFCHIYHSVHTKKSASPKRRSAFAQFSLPELYHFKF